jgi:hypothetical protein
MAKKKKNAAAEWKAREERYAELTREIEKKGVTVNLTPKEIDVLARIVWHEAGMGGKQPMVNVAVSVINKKVAGMYPELGQNGEYKGKDVSQIVAQPRRYEPVWPGEDSPTRQYNPRGDIYKLPFGKDARRQALTAVREAIMNLEEHWHNGALFEQKSVTEARGTSFGRAINAALDFFGNPLGKDSVGHQFYKAYGKDHSVFVPKYSIGAETVSLFNATPLPLSRADAEKGTDRFAALRASEKNAIIIPTANEVSATLSASLPDRRIAQLMLHYAGETSAQRKPKGKGEILAFQQMLGIEGKKPNEAEIKKRVPEAMENIRSWQARLDKAPDDPKNTKSPVTRLVGDGGEPDGVPGEKTLKKIRNQGVNVADAFTKKPPEIVQTPPKKIRPVPVV